MINDKIEKQLDEDQIILYMKGDPSMPMCGFSAKVIDILQQYDINFKTYNILMDEELRQGLKDYSQWPTFPQLYINKELIGGCDIIVEMHEKGELEEILKNHH
mgnify:CR=1 FL=1